MAPHIVICGAGFGGLELTARLSAAFGPELNITLIDKNDAFIFGFSKFEIMFGRQSREDVSSHYTTIAKPGVEFRQEDILSIDPTTRRVKTDRDEYGCDILVVALGADYVPEATPGFIEGGYEYYSVPGAARLAGVLPTIERGRVVISILGVPFKCPPAPYEGAFLLHDYLVELGVRNEIEMQLISPMPSPIPVSPTASAAIVGALKDRDIGVRFGHRVHSIDPASKTATMGDEEIPYDVFIGIPVHKAPDVVQASGLTEGGTDGWVKVDKTNLRTPYAGVYALGDCADAPVPRAGSLAESAARAVADDIGATVRSETFDAPYEGRGVCFVEFGRGEIGMVNVDFLSGPTPQAPLVGPSRDLRRKKDEWGAERRKRWFGL